LWGPVLSPLSHLDSEAVLGLLSYNETFELIIKYLATLVRNLIILTYHYVHLLINHF
jgi:hypothetical protein